MTTTENRAGINTHASADLAADASRPVATAGHAFQVAVVIFAVCVAWFAFTLYSPFTALYLVHDLGVATAADAALLAAFAFSATGLGVVLFSPVWGALSDSIGRKFMLVRALLGAAVTIGAMGLVANAGQLIALRFAWGVLGGITTAGPAMVATLAPARRAGEWGGLVQRGPRLAENRGPLARGVIIATWGYRQPYWAAAALVLFGAALVYLYVSETAEFRAASVSAAESKSRWRINTRELGSSRLLLTIAMMVFSINLALNAVNPILPLYVQDLFGAEAVPQLTGLTFGATGVLGIVSALTAGALADRFGYRKMLLAAIVGTGLAYGLHTWAVALVPFLLARMLLGVFQGAVLPMANALTTQAVSRAQQGAAFGLIGSASFLGTALGPILGALISTKFGISALFSTIAIAFLALAFLLCNSSAFNRE